MNKISVKKRNACLLRWGESAGNDTRPFPAFHNRNTILLTILLTTLFVACAPYSSSRMTFQPRPETRIIDMKASIVMKAVTRVLADKKFTLHSEQTNLQHFRTEWLQDGPYRSMVYGEIKPINKGSSRLSVNIVLQKKKLWQKDWQPVDKIGSDIYDEFMNAVLIESYRVLYDGG